jgi:hypothetical protein
LPLITEDYLKDFAEIPGLHLIATSTLRGVPDSVSLNEALLPLR